ncbi:MAG: hypothetical protein ABI824_00765 [Acidobacteriota bacterium]
MWFRKTSLVLYAMATFPGGEFAYGQSTASSTQPEFTFRNRMKWVGKSAISTNRLAGYAFSSALATDRNKPKEYGPHWDGYGKRIGLRLSTGATGLLMESSIGAVWGEDPRYRHVASGSRVKARLWNAVKMSFMAKNAQGKTVPAYARYIAVPANSFASNAWRPDSQARAEEALRRIPLSFMDRIIANAVTEFLPDLMKPFHH